MQLDQLEKSLLTVSLSYLKGELSENVYFMCLVCAAHDFLYEGQIERGEALLRIPPLSYYRDVQLGQMEEDERYNEIVIRISYRLIQLGLAVGSEELFVPNMKVGRA